MVLPYRYGRTFLKRLLLYGRARSRLCCMEIEPEERFASDDDLKITEGSATILFPNSNEVFYNPVQEFNRDLSIAVIKSFAENLWTPSLKKNVRHRQKLAGSKSVPDQSDGNGTAACDGAAEKDCGDSEERELNDTTIEAAEDDRQLSIGGGKEEKDNVIKEEPMSGGILEEKLEVTSMSEEEEKHLEDKDKIDKQNNGMKGEDTKPSAKHVKERTGLRVLEALAASGLRSIRYAREIPQLESVIANDISEKAYQSMQRNIAYNKMEAKVSPSCRDASMLMYESRDPYLRFDVVDLDPYGSPSTFLDATMQSVKDGGLLCVTCTDMSVLCGVRSEVCHSKYGATSLKTKYCHEMALRIALSSLESHANRYQRYIVPLLSCSIDFYIRLFVRVFTGAREVKKTPSKLANVYHCIGCESFHLQPIGKFIEQGDTKKYPPGTGPPVDRRCDQCNSVFRLGGPMWAAPLYDPEFVQVLLKEVDSCPAGTYNTKDRIKGLLTVISEELLSVPLFYELDSACSTLHCDTPKMVSLRSAILAQGYEVSFSHTNPNAVKTNAPHHVFWDIMRCWAGQRTKKDLSSTSPGAVILSREPKTQACFDIRKDANPPSRLLKLARFPENPESNWGPKARAKRKGTNLEDGASSKRSKRNQSKAKEPKHN